MPTDKKRTNVALSEEAHALAKNLASRDCRTIGLLIEFLLRRYAEERGWTDLLAAADLLTPTARAPQSKHDSPPAGEAS